MKKTELVKKFELKKIDILTELKSILQDFKMDLEMVNGKTFRSPLKNTLIEKLKNKMINNYFNCGINSNNEIYIIINFYFRYYNIFEMLKNKRDFSECKQYQESFTIYFLENQIKNNNIDYMISIIDNKINDIKTMLETFDQDLETLKEAYKTIETLENKINNINYNTKEYFNNGYSGHRVSLWNITKFNILAQNNNYYLLKNDDIFKTIETLKNESNYFNNNYNNIIDIEFKENLLYIYFYNKNVCNNIIVDIKENKIIKNNLDDINFSSFEKLENMSDQQFTEYQAKAKKKLYFLGSQDNIFCLAGDGVTCKNITFKTFNDENCFISSSDLHGFYFPNLQIKHVDLLNNIYNFVALCFMDGVCYGLFENQESGDLIIL